MDFELLFFIAFCISLFLVATAFIVRKSKNERLDKYLHDLFLQKQMNRDDEKKLK